MQTKFDFAETNTQILLTFYKTPKDVEEKRPEVINPEIQLLEEKKLLYNSEEIGLFAPVKLGKIVNLKHKCEVVLEKATPGKWNSINGEYEVPRVRDEIYKTEENENSQDLMELFRKIYSSGDENVKKAMNKSLEESGGTVLSTDWSKVSSKKVEPEN